MIFSRQYLLNYKEAHDRVGLIFERMRCVFAFDQVARLDRLASDGSAILPLGDQLPFHWRELKQLQRRHLATFGLSEDACNPRARESFAELVEQSLLVNGLPLLHRILDQGSPLIEAGLLDPDGLKAALTALESGPYSEDPWSKLVEVITLDQAARAFLP